MSSPISAGTLRPRLSTSLVIASAAGDVAISVDDIDRTRTFLLLHGGGGAPTMSGFAELLANRTRSRVIVPTHPGFGGTPRPEGVSSIRDLAAAYLALLDQLDLSDVTVLGNSFGGWLAAEIALMGSPRVSGAVIVDGIGIEVPDHPVTDIRGLRPDEIRALSFHDPGKAPVPPNQGTGQGTGAGTGQAADEAAGPSPDLQALLAYTGGAMADPTLLERLASLKLPVQVIWGSSDGIVDADYGRAYAAAIPASTFTVLPNSGHMPQIETPEELLRALADRGDQTSGCA